jgi:hypothetical protein
LFDSRLTTEHAFVMLATIEHVFHVGVKDPVRRQREMRESTPMAIAAEHLGLRPTTGHDRHLRVVPAPRSRPAPRASAATYRRRRAVLALALMVLVGLAVVASAGMGAQGATAAVPVAAQSIVVTPGDTVWDLARTHAPEGVAAGAYAMEILRLNDVEPARLAPGSVLRLPAR